MVLNYSSFVIDPKWDQGVVFFLLLLLSCGSFFLVMVILDWDLTVHLK